MLFTEVLTYAWFDIGTIPSFNGLRKILIMDLNVCRMEKSLNIMMVTMTDSHIGCWVSEINHVLKIY